MARRALWLGAVGTLGVIATVGTIVGTAPSAPAARSADADVLHPNLVRLAAFVAGPDSLTQDVPTQPGAVYRLSLTPPAGPQTQSYEVTFGSGTTELTSGAGPIALDVPATGSMTPLTVAPEAGNPVLPTQVSVRRAD